MGWTKGKPRFTPEERAERAVVRLIGSAVAAAITNDWPKARLLDVLEQKWVEVEAEAN